MTYSTPATRVFQRYDGPSIVLHWMTAFLVLLQFVLAECWSWPTKPVHHLMVVTHLTAGIILSVIMVFRVVWRLTKGRHLPNHLQPMSRVLALGVEYTLYALILAEIVLGYLWRWGGGQPMSFFGVLFPAPFAHFQKASLLWIHSLHDWNAWLIIILATGHGLAALFHHLILKDHVLERMLPGRSGG
ncbi:cytochrome b [Acetobacter okinawensis]|uniref:cytochrome b n=1 Tax=Acetobacter okinawensis TaxID=1076594 RepID=UPI000471D6CB